MENLGEAFLHQKNPKLHREEKIEKLQKYKKMKDEDVSLKPADKLAAWLKHIEKTHLGHKADEAYINRLKRYYYKQHIIKAEEVPESYYDKQKRLARERGHGDIILTEAQRNELANILIKDQKASFDNWFDYFISEDSNSFPIWAKYWAFDGMLKLGTYHKNKKKFSCRTQNTVAPFADLDREALAYAMDLLIKKVGKEEIADLKNNEELQKVLTGANFGKLYSYAIEKVSSAEQHEMEITEGEWRKFEQGSDHMPLVKSLQGHGTGWCTAGEMTGKKHLEMGDFYVYYSKNKDGQAVNPRIAIRMEGINIAEVRGIAADQNMDKFITETDILEDKLEDFSDAEHYKKKTANMKRLTEIDEKTSVGEELTKEDLKFLYEIDERIIGFGYGNDPRIKEIIFNRNVKKDISSIRNYKEEEITSNKDEFLAKQGKIKFHYGDLDLLSGIAVEIMYPGYKNEQPIFNISFNEMVGDINLSALLSAEGLNLPKKMNGNLNLNGLKSVDNLILPEFMNGDIHFNSLKSANKLLLPKKMNGNLKFHSLESANGVVFPEIMNGDLYLSALTSVDGLILPKEMNGDFDFSSLESAVGLVLPEIMNGGIGLGGLKNLEGLVLPKVVKGRLEFDSLESIRGLDLSGQILGPVYLPNLSNIAKRNLKRKFPHIKFEFEIY